jgi:RimJ/RimL family protein N-acetyltransferase
MLSLPTFWSSPKLHVRYLCSADLPDVVRMLAKPEVCADVMFGPNTEAQTVGYFGPLLEAQEAALARGELPTSPNFALLDPQSGAFAGEAAALEVAYAPGCWMIGYQLDAPFWGRRLGTWAGRFVLQHALFDLDARRITGDCLATNASSRRILTGLGLRSEGTQREHYEGPDGFTDNLLFGALRPELDEERTRGWRQAFVPK